MKTTKPMKRTASYAARGVKVSSVPAGLTGDWTVNGTDRYRFNNDGVYSVVLVMPYTILNDTDLQFPTETYKRVSGTTGIAGVWRQLFATGERLDLTFGPYSLYAFEWDDGYSGGGYYSSDASNVALVETRKHFRISGSTLTFIDPDTGATDDASFAIAGDTLTIGTTVYARVPF